MKFKPKKDSTKLSMKCIITIIIVLQSLMIILVGINKVGFHIDENYSYILSNSYDSDRISNADWMWGNWVDEEDFDEFVTVQNDEQFSFSSVYRSNSNDCHPPLFYWALHTISSFFPNIFNKWFGILLNVVCFIITECFLWLISKELIASPKLKVLPLVLYGFSWLALDTCIFIRMYMMLTMFTIIFSYIQIRMLKYGITLKRIIWNAIIIYLGAMTQYYFVIFAFFAVLLQTLYLFSRKKVKYAFIYGGTSLIAVLLMVVSYPFVLTQATGSSTNNIGNEITKNLFNFKLWGKQILSLANDIGHQLAYSFKLVVILTIILIFLAVILLIIRKKQNMSTIIHSKKCFIWLILSLIAFYLAITFIGGDYVYTRYMYMVIPLCYLLIVIVFDTLLSTYNKMQLYALIICSIFAVTNCIMIYINDSCSYLFKNDNEVAQQLEQYEDENLLAIVKEKSTAIPTGNYWLYKSFNMVYMDTADNIISNEIFEKCLERNDSFVVYIAESGYWIDGFDPDKLLEEYRIKSNFKYRLITEANFGSYYQIQSVS